MAADLDAELTTHRAEPVVTPWHETLAEVQRAVADVHAHRARPPWGDDTPAAGHSPRVSFRVPEQTRRRAEERARAEGRSVSEVAREALERYLAS
ncbi:MAG: ribbon-helix-helix protein, CopG family [Actinobacteria bacterium]|nr:ribbon-helix-helix protein, CopG family [Actinomycetota bacterium]